MEALLPELVDSRFPIRNKKDDIREAVFVKEAMKKKRQKRKNLRKENSVIHSYTLEP